MSTSRDTQDGMPPRAGTTRRSLLRGAVALTGGALVAPAAGALAAEKSAPPTGKGTADKSVSRTQKVKRATRPLEIRSPLRVVKSVGPVENTRVRVPRVRAVAAAPSTRAQALDALARAPGGRRLLQQYAVAVSEGSSGDRMSPILRSMQRAHTLASAYAAGITLTPRGCEYAGGIYQGHDPIEYQTHRGWVNAEVLQGPDCCIHSEKRERLDDNPRIIVPLLTVDLITPGDPDQSMAYLLELHAAGYDDDRVEVAIENDTVQFSRTSAGTRVAVVELGGSSSGGRGGRAFHRRLNFEQRVDELVHFYFYWLNVIAI